MSPKDKKCKLICWLIDWFWPEERDQLPAFSTDSGVNSSPAGVLLQRVVNHQITKQIPASTPQHCTTALDSSYYKACIGFNESQQPWKKTTLGTGEHLALHCSVCSLGAMLCNFQQLAMLHIKTTLIANTWPKCVHCLHKGTTAPHITHKAAKHDYMFNVA